LKAPKYEKHCAYPHKKPTIGSQWIHDRGVTLWVCSSCANKLGKRLGLESAMGKGSTELK